MSGDPGIAYKAYEIEEFVDIYVFRRAGILVARGAQFLRLTPNAVSVLAGLVGAAGGLLLLDDDWVPLGVALIVAYGVFDSADGQLARLTGRTSEWGRVLDGLSGYATHIAAYLAIAIRMSRAGGGWWVVLVTALAGVCTAIHSQLYDYHRTVYTSIVLKGQPTVPDPPVAARPGLLGFYEGIQRRVAGRHPIVERDVAAHASGGRVDAAGRDAYRAWFHPLIPAWNLFGDNVRRYGFVALALLHRLDWYFAFILVPMNAALLVVWLLQWRADTGYLGRPTATTSALSSAGR